MKYNILLVRKAWQDEKNTFFVVVIVGLVQTSTAQSDLYRRYASRDDMTVAEVSGYHVYDSIVVDVTMFLLQDSVGWEQFMREMNISEKMADRQRTSVRNGNDPIAFYRCRKNRPEEHIYSETDDCDFVVYVWNKRVLLVVNTENEQHRRLLVSAFIDKSLNGDINGQQNKSK